MLTLIIGLVVGVLVGWYTTRPEIVDTTIEKLKGLVKK